MNDELKTLLKWQLEMGVDETIGNEPVSLLEKSAAIQNKRNPQAKAALTSQNIEKPQAAAIPTAAEAEAQPTFHNPPPTFKPVAMPKKSENHSHDKWIEKARELADNSKTLPDLRAAVEGFDGLSIKKTAHNTVFAEGAETADIMLIGEAPGENEDIKGVPFCGVSGRLLDDIFRHIGHTRDKNLYITNSLFWRPPGNRRPTPEEIAICRPFVEKHIALVNPKILVLVGATATASVLHTAESISKLRKASQEYKCPYLGKTFITRCIYHPSYLLRQPSQKKTSWFDALEIKKLADVKK